MSQVLGHGPKNAETYSKTIDTMTFDEWVEHTSLWMDRLRFADEHRLSAAFMLLRVPMLLFWRSWQDEIGEVGTWKNF